MAPIIKKITEQVNYINYNKNNNFLVEESIIDIDQTFLHFVSSIHGLEEQDAQERLLKIGLNQVPHKKIMPMIWGKLIRSLNNPFIFILIVISVTSFFIDYWLPLKHHKEPNIIPIIVMLIMVSLSGLLCFYQELQTNRSVNALKYTVKTTATVLRRPYAGAVGQCKDIILQELVPGDIILLSAGDIIPADIKLFESDNFLVNQSILTGKPLHIKKNHLNTTLSQEKYIDNIERVLELSNICIMGTHVTSGTAKAIILATGVNTYFSSLTRYLVNQREKNLFEHGINRVSWLLIRFMLFIVPIVFIINGITKRCWADAALFALSVAVGITPEMLPIIISANFAHGLISLSRKKVIVKNLSAMQHLGSMDVLCTDKTGTLTEDCLILKHYIDINGRENKKILHLAWLNSHYQSGIKNSIDLAITKFVKTLHDTRDIVDLTKIDELPFDFNRRRLSIIISDKDCRHTLICKGAVEEMMTIATHINNNGNILPLDDKVRNTLLQLVTFYNKQGFRVLMIGTRDFGIKGCIVPLSSSDEKNIVIFGLLTFFDAPKDFAVKAINALHEKGVTIKVLTGDNHVVTQKICLDIGLKLHKPLLGYQIEEISDKQLALLVEERTIFAKLTPCHKSRILKALMSNGHIVGFLGDAINDALALRDANVGISVDTGAAVSKESADIVLLEKNLMVLVEIIITGRKTFGNIIKYLNITASSNFGNVISVLVSSFCIPFLPMMAIQLMLQNFIYDISQFALLWDDMDKEFLYKPRRWNTKNIGRFMLWIGPISSVFDIITYFIMWFCFSANSIEQQGLFQSGWFIESLLSQMLVIHMLRTHKIPFIQSTATWPIIIITSIIIILGIYIPYSTLGTLVGFKALPWQYFPWLVGILIIYCIIIQLVKHLYIKRFGLWF
ncbi:magnesium-translocating P-type ATPase [Candidatus Profftia sp. (ex Adelges kitamiensis)]|uniref:magnesium-translocating P-type ATPase n=1 Tax=Candidatus Profftia sp. (ex Adelges kitamiensis) TaxID=2864218 RepID=UPI001CE3130C|nr:magnesium-translocating P-type ATPase [Candidatus Profftia sp. (ex Adelges kitamiensis)]